MYDVTSMRDLGIGVNSVSGFQTWQIVSVVLAIVGGFFVYFTFLSANNEGKYTGFLAWLYDFLHFKKMFLETILKVTYIILALYITLSSFALIGTNLLLFLLTLLGGNILLRLTYEFSLILLTICQNTTEINAKLKGKETKKETKTEEKVQK